MIILGIDPGTTRIGYGVVRKKGGGLEYVTSGLVSPLRGEHGEKLAVLERRITAIAEEAKPTRVGLEKLYFTKNKKTALAVAEARGVILNAVTKMGIPVFEIGPNEVKLAVAGDGRASKKAVSKMVNLFLKTSPKNAIDDVSDALAIAIAVSNLTLENS